MATIIPLIRAAVLVPWVRWLERHEISPEPRLADADLGYLPVCEPNCPVPLLNVVEFIRRMAATEGADIGCRVFGGRGASASTIRDLANLGLVMQHGGTPRGALRRASAALPRHCTHEMAEVLEIEDGIIVNEVWQWDFDAEALHVLQQSVASIIECVCSMTGREPPFFEHVRLVEHPVRGLDHLAGHFACPVLPAAQQRLEIRISNDVADAAFRETAIEDTDVLPAPDDWARLRDDGTLSASARIALAVMLRSGPPTVGQLAFSAGMSVRTLQRRLAGEGTSFFRLLDEVRCDIARESLAAGTTDVATLSSDLGYSHPAALSRAVRRWTGAPPRKLRRTSARKA